MKFSLRARYFISFLLILIPVLLFLTVLYVTNDENNTRYVNTATLEKFTYASQNINSVFEAMKNEAQNAGDLENVLNQISYSPASAAAESSLTACLENLENRLTVSAQALLYFRGDRHIYTSSGKYLYSDFEKQVSDKYDLTMSFFFGTISSKRVQTFLPVRSAGKPSGIACITPFPVRSPENTVLIFLMSSEIIHAEFQKYLEINDCDLYLYSSDYTGLYEYHGGDVLLPFRLLTRQLGVGIRKLDDLILTTVADTQRGFTCAMVTKDRVFYRDTIASRRFMTLLMILLVLMLLLLFGWLTFFNYKPIQKLANDITGSRQRRYSSDELELIRSSWGKTVEELEAANTQIEELAPLVTQQLTDRLIHGKIRDRAEFQNLIRYAGLHFQKQWLVALYVLLQKDTSASVPFEQLSVSIRRWRPAGFEIIQGDYPEEGAVCLILNFDSGEDAQMSTVQEAARQLLAHLAIRPPALLRIGIGSVSDDPLRMTDSYAEAAAAALMPASSSQDASLAFFLPESGKENEESETRLRELSPMSSSLLSSAVSRADAEMAKKALLDLLASVSPSASVFVFRYYASAIAALLVRTASEERLTITPEETKSLIDFASPGDFRESASRLCDSLCRRRHEQMQHSEGEEQRVLMTYLLAHYKEPSLSVQSVADETGLSKGRIAACLRKDIGLNFVQYISSLRMEEFKRLLMETDHTIAECVREIGYSDVPNFLRKFKQNEGVTAGVYREKTRNE